MISAEQCILKEVRSFSFHQKHFPGYLKRTLDDNFILNSLQVAVVQSDILTSFLSETSPVFISVGNWKQLFQGSGF